MIIKTNVLIITTMTTFVQVGDDIAGSLASTVELGSQVETTIKWWNSPANGEFNMVMDVDNWLQHSLTLNFLWILHQEPIQLANMGFSTDLLLCFVQRYLLIKVDIKLPNISMSVMKKKFQTNPLDHLDHSLQGDILKLEALEKKKKNKHKARNETSSSFRWSNSLVEVELPDQVFIIIHFRLLPSSYCQVLQILNSLTLIPFWAICQIPLTLNWLVYQKGTLSTVTSWDVGTL